jgi:ATP-dependent Clp protease protease subunit
MWRRSVGGQAESTAAVPPAAGAPGKRTALADARIVVQQPGFAEPVQGQPSDLNVHAKELLRMRTVTAGLLERHTEQDAERITADIERDRVFDAEEARAYGLVDRVLESREGSSSALAG